MKYLLLILTVSSVLISACAIPIDNTGKPATPDYSGSSMIVPDAQVKKLIVFPAIYTDSFKNETSEIYRKKKGDLLTSMVYNELALNRVNIRLVPHFETLKVYKELSSRHPGYPDLDISRMVAEELNADSVLLTRISRYSDRKGSEVGVKEPASVSLTFELYSAGSGKMLWVYHYGETQEPLLNNVSNINKFIKRGAKWITADELAREIVGRAVVKLQSAINNK